MNSNKTKAIIKQISIDAQVLISRLRDVKVGETISYQELASSIGKRKRVEFEGALGTARNRLLMDEDMVFDSVRGSGLKRVDEVSKIGIAREKIDAVRRMSKRGMKILNATNYEDLTMTNKTKFNITASHLGVLSHITSSKAAKRLEQKAIGNDGKIPSSICLEYLKSSYDAA